MNIDDQCKKRVYTGARWDFGGHRCSRKAVKDGFCKLHHPDAVKERNKKLNEKYDAQIAEDLARREARALRERKADAYDELLAACENVMRYLPDCGKEAWYIVNEALTKAKKAVR